MKDLVALKKMPTIVKFGDVVKNVNLVEQNSSTNDIERIVGLEHIDPNNLHIRRWGLAEDGTSFTRKFVPGQTLFGKRRVYQRKVAFAEFDGICSGDILTFEPKNKNVMLPEFLPFLCQSEAFYDHALSTSAGSLSPRTSWKALKAFEFPLPSLEEQKRIAEILWATDEVIEKYLASYISLKILSYTTAIKKFLLHEARKKRPILPEGWKVGVITDLSDIDPRAPKELPNSMEVAFIPMENIMETGCISNISVKNLGELRNGYSFFAEGDVLFAKITPCMENNKGCLAEGLINGIGFGSTEFFVIRPKDQSDMYFIYYLTMSKTFRKKAERWMQGTAGQRRVPRDFFEKRPIIIPPPSERVKTGSLFRSIDKSKKDLSQHIIKLKKMQSILNNTLQNGRNF